MQAQHPSNVDAWNCFHAKLKLNSISLMTATQPLVPYDPAQRDLLVLEGQGRMRAPRKANPFDVVIIDYLDKIA